MGAGVGVLPCYLASGRELVPILPDSVKFSRTYWLLFGEGDRENPRVRRVVDFIRGAIESADFRYLG